MTDKAFITTLLDLLQANLLNRPKKTFGKWRQSLQDDWLILPVSHSNAVIRFVTAKDTISSGLPIGLQCTPVFK